MKIDIVIKFDVKVVAHSEVVQNTSTTPKLSIPDHITPLSPTLFKSGGKNDDKSKTRT